MKARTLILAFSTLVLSNCAMFEPRDSGGYADDEYAAYAAQKNGTSEAYDELGLSPSKRLTDEERDALDKRMKLKRLERGLVSEKQRDQYYNFRPHLESDDERIYFLNLPTSEARDRYAMQKGIYFRTNKFLPTVRDAVMRNDIVLGMSKDAVVESWGDPEMVEVAGSRIYGNERWKYTEYVTTQEGYLKEERIVIFEAGKVVGWYKN